MARQRIPVFDRNTRIIRHLLFCLVSIWEYIEQVQNYFCACTGYCCVVTYIHLICIDRESNVERRTWVNFWIKISTGACLRIFQKSLMEKAVNYFHRNTHPWMLGKILTACMCYSFSLAITPFHLSSLNVTWCITHLFFCKRLRLSKCKATKNFWKPDRLFELRSFQKLSVNLKT